MLGPVVLDGPVGDAVRADLDRWTEVRLLPAGTPAERFVDTYFRFPEYRSLLYYRLGLGGRQLALLAAGLRLVWRGENNIHFQCPDIGPGLVLVHGFGTMIQATSVGRDVTLFNHVTIGTRDLGRAPSPILGDGVLVGVGARILGDVRLGDGCRVGANAVVVDDVPAGATVVGAKATVVERSERVRYVATGPSVGMPIEPGPLADDPTAPQVADVHIDLALRISHPQSSASA